MTLTRKLKMGLINKPAFESEADTKAAPAGSAAPAPAGSAASDAAKPKTEITKPQNTALALPTLTLNLFDQVKDALPVEYNTLNQIIANQGNLQDRETKTILGDTAVFKILSWQDAFVVSPEDDAAPDDEVRYSDDGITCSDGTLVADHIAHLKEIGFDKARLKERAVVVGAMVSAVKSDMLNGQLVQFDLSPASRTQWKRFMANASYAVSVNSKTPEQALNVKVTTSIRQGAGNNSFTLASFSFAD